MRHALDAWAVLEWLYGGEPARAKVAALLERERPVMSWINGGEVFYILCRRFGAGRATETVARLRGALTLETPSAARVLEAAALKSAYPISYADAFAISTAIAHHAVLLTGDPEILGGDPSWPIEDVRPRR